MTTLDVKPSVQNRIKDVQDYIQRGPVIKGLSEIHIFFSPINPQPKTVDVFSRICDEINARRKGEPHFTRIKACHLSLHFKNVGDLRVMQSSRYITSQDMNVIIDECYAEADQMQEMFNQAYDNGEIDEKVEVIREKIEAIASAEGVPRTNEEAKKYPRYFEYHIKLCSRNQDNNTPITDEEILELKKMSEEFSKKYNRPVPLSFVNNCMHQRYLNIRFDNIGSTYAYERVAEIVESINLSEKFVHSKTISEYVWFDSFRKLDQGWIDFDDE